MEIIKDEYGKIWCGICGKCLTGLSLGEDNACPHCRGKLDRDQIVKTAQ